MTLLTLSSLAHADRRDSWYIGFGLGYGAAQITQGEASKSYGDFTEELGLDEAIQLGFNFQVGVTLSPKLLAGFEAAAVSRQATEDEDRATLQHNQYLLTATYFPVEKGLYLKGGVGASVLVLSTELLDVKTNDSYVGLGGVAGVGYALWLGESFNLGLGSDFHMAGLSGDEDKGEPTSGWFNLTYVSLSWY